jgi:hypothetical protein
MSQLDRTHDRSPEFDVSLQAVLGLAWLLSQFESLRPDVKAAGPRADPSAPSSGGHDPAALAVLGVIAVACELSPVLDALRAGAPRQWPLEVRAEGRGEISPITSAIRGGAGGNHGGLDGLLR